MALTICGKMREDFNYLLSYVTASTCTPSQQHGFSRVWIDPKGNIISTDLQEDCKELSNNRHSEMVKMDENSTQHFIKTLIIYNKQRDWLQDADPHLSMSSRCSCSRTGSQQGGQDKLSQIPRANLIFMDNAKNYGIRKSTSCKARLAAAP